MSEIRQRKRAPMAVGTLIAHATRVLNTSAPGHLGVTLRNEDHGLGVIIEEIHRQDLFARQGFAKGECITHIDGKAVTTHEQAMKLLKEQRELEIAFMTASELAVAVGAAEAKRKVKDSRLGRNCRAGAYLFALLIALVVAVYHFGPPEALHDSVAPVVSQIPEIVAQLELMQKINMVFCIVFIIGYVVLCCQL